MFYCIARIGCSPPLFLRSLVTKGVVVPKGCPGCADADGIPCKRFKVPIGEGGYGDIMVIETRWMVVEICLFVSKEPLINPENGGVGARIPSFYQYSQGYMRGG